jgi:Zn-dependent protease with chaperone function
VNPLLVAPLLLTFAGIGAGWFLPRLASPASCVRVLTALALVAAAGVSSGLVLVALAGASELHAVSGLLGWCEALYPGDHGAAPWAGVVAALALAAGARGRARYRRRVRAERLAFASIDGVEVIRAAGPVAFAVPGRPGGVVLGDELVRALAPDERAAVLAHEQAHLDCHHHRYVHAAEACAAAFPFLIPLARQVRFNTERWADEVAAGRVGSRRLVARAIARVALLAPPVPSPGIGFGPLGVHARVDALLHPRSTSRDVSAAAASVAILAALAGSSVQMHHLATYVLHTCRA